MSGDPLADAIARVVRLELGFVDEELRLITRLKAIGIEVADAIRSGALAEALADVPAEALGFEASGTTHMWVCVPSCWHSGGPHQDGCRPIPNYRRVNVGSADE